MKKAWTSILVIAHMVGAGGMAFAYDVKYIHPSSCTPNTGSEEDRFNSLAGYTIRIADSGGIRLLTCPILRDNEDEELYDVGLWLNNVLGTDDGYCILYSYDEYGTLVGSDTLWMTESAETDFLHWTDAGGTVPGLSATMDSSYSIVCGVPEGVRIGSIAWTDKP